MPASEASSSLIGMALEDRYRIVREIGRGGMGEVYEAEHVQLGKRVAVKVMLEKYAGDADAVARFQREALAASRIGHPHICDVHHIGAAHDGRLFVVMELLAGAPLAEVIAKTGPMPAWRAIHIMRQVLRAVGAAHAKGIIHRDLKPDNVFLVEHDDQHDFVKLLDFGISKVMNSPDVVAVTRLTTTGMVMGTPLYMAPEQAMGNDVDHRADLYACGAMLYEMLAGKPPFDGANYTVLIAKVLTATPPHLDDVRPGLPPKLVAAVHRALAKEPEDRFASADQLLATLPSDRSPSQIELAGTVGLDSRAMAAAIGERPRSRAWMWMLILIGVLGAAAIAVKFATRGANEPAAAPPAGSATAAAGSAALSAVPPPAPPAPPRTPSGRLDVKSIPAGARVSVDGRYAGVTPLEVLTPPGQRHVRIELAGYETIDEDEDIVDGERTSVVIRLPQPREPQPPVAGRPVKPRPAAVHVEPTRHEPIARPGGRNGSVPAGSTPVDAGAAAVPEPVKQVPPPPGGSKPNPY